jgi:hypothetical protein
MQTMCSGLSGDADRNEPDRATKDVHVVRNIKWPNTAMFSLSVVNKNTVAPPQGKDDDQILPFTSTLWGSMLDF